MRPNLETEVIAMRVVMEHEQAQGRQVYDVHEKNLGYDITSLDLNWGELRLIEVKGLSASSGMILLTPNERRVAGDRRDCYWLYIATDCGSTPCLQEPICDPARFQWNEVTKEYRGDSEITRMITEHLNQVLNVEGFELVLLGVNPQIRERGATAAPPKTKEKPTPLPRNSKKDRRNEKI
jgi:hypothetical protein